MKHTSHSNGLHEASLESFIRTVITPLMKIWDKQRPFTEMSRSTLAGCTANKQHWPRPSMLDRLLNNSSDSFPENIFWPTLTTDSSDEVETYFPMFPLKTTVLRDEGSRIETLARVIQRSTLSLNYRGGGVITPLAANYLIKW